jgi:hypothetical protein
MTSSKRISIAFLSTTTMAMALVLYGAAGQTSTPQQAVLPVGSAVVTEIKGEVVFTSPEGAPVVAQRGSTLTANTKVETAKGSVLLELQDGSQVLIKGHSNVVLRAPNEQKGFSLELFIGQIIVKVQKRLGASPSFRMGTPSAVITVRGTRFSVEVNKKKKTYVNVFEGLVEVQGLMQSSPPILIKPGFSTGVEENRAPEGPRESGSGEGNEREGGRQSGHESDHEGRGQGTEDQQKNQPKPGPPSQGSDGKPD